MKVLFLSILFLFTAFSAKTQQWVDFTQKNHYKLFINPANSGADNNIYATLAHRSQYTFLSKRALASQFGEFSMPIINKNYGLGIKLINDFIGYQRYTSGEITGAYHLTIKKSKLSFGIGLGLINLSLDGAKLRAPDGVYENESINHNDDLLLNFNVGGFSPTFSLGMIYDLSKFQVGISVQNINSPKILLLKSNSETNINIGRTINVHTSYVIEVSKVNIIPMLNYNTDFIKHQMQVGINTELNNIYFGLAFRGYSRLNNDALIGEFGVKLIDKLRIGYSYDYNVSQLNESNFGSHEISISYKINRKLSTKNKGNVLFNPRFL